ncbi:protein-methionine-sulfoxide reductase heme-binding subunit MsrQ [Alteromonas sp. KUL49]|uniref:sulfite oxidase heme-binding subunit YedZ n=1 Tax=Alteromonas sp. KUL49 TaxID=2480798 RepID=UPI00102F29E0|nr:protein-methionine-sulfoxide reductase heme-binding subunit MsrQ [Alteromonas sp. KUL49]TAP36909.1 sulfoxide reductase heme-binding subunit YedZ [Alteromonas sp. KUL49]
MKLLNKPWRLSKIQRVTIKSLVHLFSLGYLSIIFYLGIIDNLGPDPVQALLDKTGNWAIYLLVATLLLSPIAKVLPSPEPLQFRRLLGVYSFVFALAHFLVYCAFEIQLDMSLIGSEIIERPYITVGMTALVLLLALAATSFNKAKRMLGRRWQKLHNAVYLILPLTVLHYTWAQKSDLLSPAIYWMIVIAVFYIKRDALIKIIMGKKIVPSGRKKRQAISP